MSYYYSLYPLKIHWMAYDELYSKMDSWCGQLDHPIVMSKMSDSL